MIALEMVGGGLLCTASGQITDDGVWRNGERAVGRARCAAAVQNTVSKANGALLRATSLGAWGWRQSEEDLVVAAMADAGLTDPNPTFKHASAAYCLAIRHLVLRPGDGAGAFFAAKRWADRAGAEEALEWLGLDSDDVDVGYFPFAGVVKQVWRLVLGRAARDAARWRRHGQERLHRRRPGRRVAPTPGRAR